MSIHPNKPVIFGVEHELRPVRAIVPKFQQALIGRKRLYIELSDAQLDFFRNLPPEIRLTKKLTTSAGAYYTLVELAEEMGLKVIPLDSGKLDEKVLQAQKTCRVKVGHHWYANLAQRESSWARQLREENSRALVVMHQAHAKQIILKLQLPKENVLHLDKVYDSEFERRTRIDARLQRKQFIKKRLARKLQHARERTKRLPATPSNQI